MTDVARVREQQRQLYGAPLNELLQRCAGVLQVNQGQMARLLGVSAPMLSQLINGHRIKLANPAAGVRLVALVQAVEAVSAGELSVAQAMESVAEADSATTFTATGQTAQRRSLAADIQAVFRAVASGEECAAAARLLDADHPEVAELIAVFGVGDEGQAEAWVERRRRG